MTQQVTTQEKQRVLLHRDETKKAAMQQSIENIAGRVNAAYQTYLKLGLGNITLTDLIGIHEPDLLVRQQVFEQNKASLGNLPLQRQVVLQMLELPTGTTDFLQAFEGIKSLKNYLHEFPLDLFTTQNGQVKALPGLADYIDRQCSIYATTQEQIEAYEVCQKAFEMISDLKRKFPSLALFPPAQSSPTVFSTGTDGKLYFSKLSTKNVR